jgi:hypothetical protein
MSIRICFPLADEETRERERALSRRLLRNVNTSTVWFWIYIYTWREVKFQILEALFFPFFFLLLFILHFVLFYASGILFTILQIWFEPVSSF